MAEFVYVRPKDGLKIVDPVRRDRLPEGQYRRLDYSLYWQRLAAMGDVTLSATAPPDDEIEGYEPPAGAQPKKKAPRRKAAPKPAPEKAPATPATQPAADTK